MKTLQTTASNYFNQQATVSHLAKTTALPLKTANSLLFEAKTHPLKNPRTLTHAQGTLELFKQKPNKQRVIGLFPKYHIKFLAQIPLIFTNKPVKVVYHNNEYVNQLFENYRPVLAELFLKWVTAFCIIRREYRQELSLGVYQTHEDDFTDAIILFREQEFSHRQTKPLNVEDALLNVIKKHFASSVFNAFDLKQFCTLTDYYIKTGLQKLLANDKLRVNKFVHGIRQYEIY
jgi:hypothetical protein